MVTQNKIKIKIEWNGINVSYVKIGMKSLTEPMEDTVNARIQPGKILSWFWDNRIQTKNE